MGEAKYAGQVPLGLFSRDTVFSSNPTSRDALLRRGSRSWTRHREYVARISNASGTWRWDDTVGGFTKNTIEAKLAAEAEMRRNNRQRALQLAAFQFAGPLAEYRACIARYSAPERFPITRGVTKTEAFRTFAYANAVYGATTLRDDTGDIDFLPGNFLVWNQPGRNGKATPMLWQSRCLMLREPGSRLKISRSK